MGRIRLTPWSRDVAATWAAFYPVPLSPPLTPLMVCRKHVYKERPSIFSGTA